jgi:hypothetical protein
VFEFCQKFSGVEEKSPRNTKGEYGREYHQQAASRHGEQPNAKPKREQNGERNKEYVKSF